jgi:streptogramin lyase
LKVDVVVRVLPYGRSVQMWKLRSDAGRIAAVNRGCCIPDNGTLLHIDPSGRLHRSSRAPFGDIATGAGAVWLAETTKVVRIDERTGQTRSIPTGTLRLGGFQHDLAATNDALYLLQHTYTATSNSRLVKIDLGTGTVTRSSLIAGIADAVVISPHGVWVATATSNVSQYDPRTLRRTLVFSVP